MRREDESGHHDRLIEGIDFYREGEFVVLSESFLRRRGYCCESGCRHCPYGFERGGADGSFEPDDE